MSTMGEAAVHIPLVCSRLEIVASLGFASQV